MSGDKHFIKKFFSKTFELIQKNNIDLLNNL